MLVGIVLKPADATGDVPAFVLCHAAEHAKNMPSDNNEFKIQGGIPMQWLVGTGEMNGENYRYVCDRIMDVDTEIARGQPRFVLKDNECSEDVRPGCIGISFQRGHAEWNDERYDEPCNDVSPSYAG